MEILAHDRPVLHPFYSRSIERRGSKPTRPAFVSLPNGCIVWDGATNSKGYAIDGRGLMHRHVWTALKGPIPPNHDIHHVSRNKLCCNVEHLDCLSRTAHVWLEKKKSAKLDDGKVVQILALSLMGFSRAQLAEEYDVSPGPITQIRSGRCWKDVFHRFRTEIALQKYDQRLVA